MRTFSVLFFGCALVVGCASPSRPPKKPLPYHYATTMPMLTRGALAKELS
jgi:hypothetical protein